MRKYPSTKSRDALSEQIVRVPLGGSLDQETDPLLVQPGQVATAENIVYDKTGRVSKDPGIQNLPYKFQFASDLGWSFVSVNLISEFKDSLLVAGRVVDQRGYNDPETHTRLCQYEELHQAFDPSRLGSNSSRDNTWSPVGQDNISYSQSNSNIAWPGMAITASYCWYSCVGPLTNRVRLVVIEKATETRFQTDLTLTGAVKTRLLEVGSNVILLCATATKLWGMYFSKTDPTTASAWIDLGLVSVGGWGTPASPQEGWECCAYNNQLIISRIDNATSQARFDLYSSELKVWVDCTGTQSTNKIGKTSHGLSEGDEISFRSITGGSGINTGTSYYVVNPGTNDFKITPSSSWEACIGIASTDRINKSTYSVLNDGDIVFFRSLVGGSGVSAGTAYYVINRRDLWWVNCTGTASSDLINKTSHGLIAGDEVVFRNLIGGAGIAELSKYYVVNALTDTFQISLTPGGAPVDFTTNMTSGQYAKGSYIYGDFQISLTLGGSAVNFTTDISSGEYVKILDFTTDMTAGQYSRGAALVAVPIRTLIIAETVVDAFVAVFPIEFSPYDLGACWRNGNNIRFAKLVNDLTAVRTSYPVTLYTVGATDIVHTITGSTDLQDYYANGGGNTQDYSVRIIVSREMTVVTPSALTAQVKVIDQAVINVPRTIYLPTSIYHYIILSNASTINGRMYLIIGNEHSGASLVTTGRNKTQLIPVAWFAPEEVAAQKKNLSQIYYDSSADKLYATYNRNDYQNDFFATGKIFTMSAHCRGLQLDNGYVAGGGFIATFDGCPVDCGYWHPPEIKEITSPTGGALSGGTYSYRATYEWIDGNGEIHISQPSSPVDLTATMNDKGYLWVRPISLGSEYRNNNVKIVIYRNTQTTPTIYFRVAEAYNSVYSSGVTISDTMSDITAESQPQLYTTGGVFSNTTPPPARILFRHQGRIWAINDDDKKEIWPSKPKIAGVAPEFCPEMTIRMPEDILGFGSQGDNLLAFGRKRIYSILGDGPNSIGVGSWPEPRPISFDTGTNNEKSVKQTDYGTVFQNDRGIFVIGSQSNIQLISDAVTTELGTKQIVAVVSELGRQAVKIFLEGVDSKVLIYDFKHQRWSIASLGAGVSVGTAGNYGLNTVHFSTVDRKLRKTGTLYKLVQEKMTMKVVSPWINLQGLATFKRLWWIDIIGEWKAQHNLVVKISQDYVSTYDQTVTFDCSSSVSPYLLRIKPARQKCMAIKVEVYDDEVWLACTGTQSTNKINRDAHGLTAGETVSFRLLVGGTGLTEVTTYYVVNPTTNDFQVSLSSGGTAVNFTTDMTSGEFYKRGNSCTLTGLELHLATKNFAARTYGKDG